jgi:hypothetical protein
MAGSGRELSIGRNAISRVTPAQVFKQGNAPDQSVAVTPDQPLPWTDDLWIDTVNHLTKRCTSMNPYVWASIEGGGGGPSTNDPFITWTTAGDLTNQKVVGSFLTSVLQTSLAFSRGGTILTPSAPINVIVWQAPFACTVTNVRGYVIGATGATVNARNNGANTHLASDLTLGSTSTWLDGGAVQNTAYAIGDKMEIMVTGLGGGETQIAIEVILTRP